MNPVPEPKDEVLTLCDSLLDGTLSEAEKQRLESLVIGQLEARRAYVEYMQLHTALSEARLSEMSLTEIVNMASLPEEDNIIPFTSKPGLHVGWLAAAASIGILVAGWGIGHWQGASPDEPLAVLVDAKGTRWDSGTLPTEVGASLSQGRIRLAAGLATIEFRKGARLTLEGPADLELITADKCFLHSGALVAHVPPPAVGFVVETAHARLVDHGTDFGISAGADGEAQVQVFKGEVELQHHSSGEQVKLLTKQSATVSSENLSRNGQSETETERSFARRSVDKEGRIVTITTVEGNGKANYVASPGTKTHFSDTLLLLKHTDHKDCRRKAWLGFDLTSLQGREVKDASLTLTFEPTGFGYASLLPDCVFTVYGLTDHSLDGWSESDLSWDNAPANDSETAGVDMSKAVALGTFTIPQGVLEGAFTMRSVALAEFLNKDSNRFATLMVIRETKETLGGGVVHGFAGNRHPTLKPPTLRLSLQ
ncbi:FecR domain-containing protein [soil metagenome]